MNTTSSIRCLENQRGSVLIVSLLISAVIAIALASYLKLGANAMQLSHRALYSNAAINLAETGLEEAIWSINRALESDPDAWIGWEQPGTSLRKRTFDKFSLNQGITGEVTVYVEHAFDDPDAVGPNAPVIHTRASLTPTIGAEIQKWVSVELTRRSLFSNGLLAKNRIQFNGNNAMVDSYDSRLGHYDEDLGNGKRNRFANGPAASISTETGKDINFDQQNANIFGYVSVGTTKVDEGLKIGSQGTLSGDLNAAEGTIDYTRATPNFTANLADAAVPTLNGSPLPITKIDSTIELPRQLDIDNGMLRSEEEGEAYYINVGSIDLNGGKTLTIKPGYKVVLFVTAAQGTLGINVGGNDSNYIKVSSGSSLSIYTAANVKIAGSGIINEGSNSTPSSFMLWGTGTPVPDANKTQRQAIVIRGNGNLSAVVYAPNADVTASGGGSGGSISGAIVGNNIAIEGGSEFHYDQALADLNKGRPFGIGQWNELTTSEDRAKVASFFN